MNHTRIIVLFALDILVAALLASTALGGAKTPEKKWDWDPVDPADVAVLEP
jgi:hypothetical protein